jgi:chemotaxis protein methyltransferase CheR
MDDSHFRRLLDRFGFSWAGYRKVRKGVKRRLARHMQETGCRSIEAYMDALEKDPEIRFRFECLMTVPISRFFRDRVLWLSVQERILPVMAVAAHVVKVWSAGCASGEEVYTFKILWEEWEKCHIRLPGLSILATDLCPQVLERARAAVYPASSISEVPETIRTDCFELMEGGKYAVKPRLERGISWQVHDLLSDPPAKGFDLIFLRNNLLTYYTDPVKIPPLIRIVDALAPGGFLIIGSHEKMPLERKDLEPLEEARYVFQKGPFFQRQDFPSRPKDAGIERFPSR